MPEPPKTREEAERVLKEIASEDGNAFGIEDLIAIFRENTGPARYFIMRLQADDPRGFEIEAIRAAADQMAEEIEGFVEQAAKWEVWERAVRIIGDERQAVGIAYGFDIYEERQAAS